MATKDTSITIKLDEETKQKVEILAKNDESNVSVIVRKAIKSYVSGQSPININMKSAKKAS